MPSQQNYEYSIASSLDDGTSDSLSKTCHRLNILNIIYIILYHIVHYYQVYSVYIFTHTCSRRSAPVPEGLIVTYPFSSPETI